MKTSHVTEALVWRSVFDS